MSHLFDMTLKISSARFLPIEKMGHLYLIIDIKPQTHYTVYILDPDLHESTLYQLMVIFLSLQRICNGFSKKKMKRWDLLKHILMNRCVFSLKKKEKMLSSPILH